MSEQMKQLAGRIKEIREICGYTAQDAAERLGIGVQKYLEYENSGENIPISVLYELTSYYGVDMTEILTGKSPRLSNYCVAKKGQGTGIDRYSGYHFESLAYNFKHRVMEPLMVTVEPSVTELVPVSHPGQELNYVVEGTVMVVLDDEEVILETGDCIYFNPEIPHGQKAMNGRTAKFLTVITV
ncbi:MAG: cupin domain-containing protein [Oscillospiraceae bacterium]|nr:cupin domain-containing protein [Oscillospiraceae bacterium]